MASEETLLSRHLRRLLPAAVRPAIVHTLATVRSYFSSNDDLEVASCTADRSHPAGIAGDKEARANTVSFQYGQRIPQPKGSNWPALFTARNPASRVSKHGLNSCRGGSSPAGPG